MRLVNIRVLVTADYQGDTALKNSLFAMVLAFVSVIPAVASGVDAAQSVQAITSLHAGMSGKSGAALPSNHPASVPAENMLVNSGKVLEVLDTDMYTYLRVTTEKGPLWIAAYKTVVTKGATVKYSNGVAMSNFHSNVLNRSFDVIVFVDSLEQVKK